MKQYNKVIIALCVSLLSFSACTDYLDQSPEMGITEEEVYSEYYAYKGAVDRGNWLVMNYTATWSNWGAYVGAMGDEQQAVTTGHPVYKTINRGTWMGSNWRDFGMSFWSETKYGAGDYLNAPAGKSMKAIRAMGLCIQNIEMLTDFPPETGYTQEELKNQLLGQAYALRAWHMFEVIRRYGPIELINTDDGGRGVFTTEYDFDRERPSYQWCADQIALDCDEAAKYLPSKWKNNVDVGRLTKASALAIKAISYMYAASPLMNTNDGALPFGQDSYNQEYAKKGLEACAQVLKEVNSGATRYKLYSQDEYLENWMSQDRAVSDEALFQAVNSNGETWNMPMNRRAGTGWFLPSHDGGWGIFNVPTQNIVDKFETINGYPVTNFTSNDPEFDAGNPYENRDPRLKMAIFCPGDVMYMSDPAPKAAMTNEAWSNPNAEGKAGWHYDHYRGKNLVYSGYFESGKWRKLGQNQYDNKFGQNYYWFYPHIRLAEIYMCMAELGNEVYGPTGSIAEASGTGVSSAADALNIIRNRVGMPDVLSEFTASKEAMRERVRNERAVEFYGEYKRWRDIRRWRTAKDILAKGIFGVDVTKKSDGTFTYASKRLDVPRVFEDKHYWYPFDVAHANKFENFDQNPGW